MSTMYEFIRKWRDGKLEEDLTWRSYDIRSAIKPRHVQAALKAIGLSYSRELGVSHFAALYEVPPGEAAFILGAWWLWSRLARGRLMKVTARAARGAEEGVGATTLPPPPSPPP